MKIELFTDCTPTNYTERDNMKDYYYRDYKNLRDVNFDDDVTPLSSKILGSIGFIMTLLFLLFI